MNQTDQPRRQNILAMIQLLKKYKPLVNEKNEVTGFEPLVTDEDEPSKDEFLATMAGAVQDIQSFIQNFDKARTNQTELVADAMMAHQAMAKVGINVHSLAEGFEKVCDRHKQALDVIEFISELPFIKDGNEDQFTIAKKAAESFINPVKLRIVEMNENPDPAGLNSHPSEPSQVIPPKETDSDSSTEDGEPRS